MEGFYIDMRRDDPEDVITNDLENVW